MGNTVIPNRRGASGFSFGLFFRARGAEWQGPISERSGQWWFLRQSVISWALVRLLLLSVMHGFAWLNGDLCGIRVEIRSYLAHPRRRSR
jgi:hypothetical protein